MTEYSFVRGGSWNNRNVRAAIRIWFEPTARVTNLSFRVVRSFE